MNRAAFPVVPLVLVASWACGNGQTPMDPPDPVATTVTLSTGDFTLVSLGETRQVGASVLDQDGNAMAGATVTWSTSSAGVAGVSGSGLVTAADNGDADITATSGAASSSLTVTVQQVAATIDLSVTDVDLDGVGDTLRVEWAVLDAEGAPVEGASATWTVVDPSVVSVSADGLFTALAEGNTTATVTSGSASAQITVSVTVAAAPTRIVFSSTRNAVWDVWAMDADGSGEVNLTNAPGSMDWLGAPAPGGETIAFVTNRDGDREIYVMEADGSNPTNLTNFVGDDFYPAWSWDGSKIAFSRDGTIWVMDADGSNQESLGVTGVYSAWSPDDTQIAYTLGSTLQVMNADGTGSTDVSPAGSDSVFGPEWSPDGARIMFTTRFGASGGHDIYLVDPDGANLVNVTNSAGTGEGWPSWSADGTRIIFSSNASGNAEIHVIDADGANEVQLTFGDFFNSYPHWVR